jgi:hypothetical protein
MVMVCKKATVIVQSTTRTKSVVTKAEPFLYGFRNILLAIDFHSCGEGFGVFEVIGGIGLSSERIPSSLIVAGVEALGAFIIKPDDF